MELMRSGQNTKNLSPTRDLGWEKMKLVAELPISFACSSENWVVLRSRHARGRDVRLALRATSSIIFISLKPLLAGHLTARARPALEIRIQNAADIFPVKVKAANNALFFESVGWVFGPDAKGRKLYSGIILICFVNDFYSRKSNSGGSQLLSITNNYLYTLGFLCCTLYKISMNS